MTTRPLGEMAAVGDDTEEDRLADALFYVYGNVTRHGAAIGPDRPGPREGYRPRTFWVDDARLVADRLRGYSDTDPDSHRVLLARARRARLAQWTAFLVGVVVGMAAALVVVVGVVWAVGR